MNIETLTWDEKLCKHFGVPINILPKIRSCSEIFGPLSISCLKGVPISGCIGDQQAALVGQNCWRPGQGRENKNYNVKLTTACKGAITQFDNKFCYMLLKSVIF